MPQNSTVVSGAPALPQAPGKLAECAHLGINIHTDSWPPGLPSPISDYKVKSILFTDGGGAGGAQGAWEGPRGSGEPSGSDQDCSLRTLTNF